MGRQIALWATPSSTRGGVWEAIADHSVASSARCWGWSTSNRQSLEGGAEMPRAVGGMFEGAGWRHSVKYGSRLEALFERPGGDGLRRRIDATKTRSTSGWLRSEPGELRERLPGGASELAGLVAELDDEELRAAVRDLGGTIRPS